MTSRAIIRSTFDTNLTRYSRSWGLWLLLIVGPVGARFMVARDDGFGVQVAVGGHLPVMTSSVLGVTLGIVLSTLLLPLFFLYLRSNITSRQPWQVEEVTAASRVAIMLGRWGADVAVLFALLAALTVAGWILGWFIVSGPLNIFQITAALWIIAAPALMGLAAVRLLFDALRFTRGGLGETVAFVLWTATLILPAAASGQPSSFAVNLLDFAGFARPLLHTAPAGSSFVIGATGLAPGRLPLDAIAGLLAPGYLWSRLAWMGLAIGLTALAGVLYRPHTAKLRARRPGRLARFLAPGPPPVVQRNAPPAGPSSFPFVNLVAAEFRLIGSGKLFLLLAAIIAGAGLLPDFRHIGSPAALLLLVFGLTAHAGRSEARGLLTLSQTTLFPPFARRVAFVLAGMCWTLLLGAPAVLAHHSLHSLILSFATGGIAAIFAITLAAISGSAFAPRLLLLIIWYGYLAS